MLQDPLLVALSVLMPAIVSSKTFPEFNYESIWNLVSFSKKQSMISSCTLLHPLNISIILSLLTATFAQYLLASDQLCDPLICHESWDVFRDVLISIINYDLKEEEEQLALLVSPILCRALKKLITSSRVPTREFFLSYLIPVLRRICYRSSSYLLSMDHESATSLTQIA